jgi:hypothetical protein
MDDEHIKSMCIRDILRLDYRVTFPLEWGSTYESIKFPEGYEKPSKEEFEAKLQELIDAQPLKELRTKRNTLLEQTDRYATLDYPHSNTVVQQTWFDYRQALRDLPANTEDPANPVWPTRPDEVVNTETVTETSNTETVTETSN